MLAELPCIFADPYWELGIIVGRGEAGSGGTVLIGAPAENDGKFPIICPEGNISWAAIELEPDASG